MEFHLFLSELNNSPVLTELGRRWLLTVAVDTPFEDDMLGRTAPSLAGPHVGLDTVGCGAVELAEIFPYYL